MFPYFLAINRKDFFYLIHFFWKRKFFYSSLLFSAFVFLYALTVFIIYVFTYAQIDVQIDEYRKWLYGTGFKEKKKPIRIYAADKKLLGEYIPERGSWITMSTCADLKWLKYATVLSEDKEFYEHSGVSYKGILRAAWRNIISFDLKEGGGTLTQQLARNLFTGRERSFYRKFYETFIAFQLESALSKDEILCLYLNKIYMGEGRIGAEEASWFYFNKPPERLDASEAAMIVGLYPSPVYYSPLNNIQLSLKKQRLVLDRMVEASQEKFNSRKRNLNVQRFFKRYQISNGPKVNSGKIGLYGASRDFRYNIAPTVTAYAKNFLYKSLPEDIILEGGLKVYTTIDSTKQSIALSIMRDYVGKLRTRMLKENKKANRENLRRWSKQLNGVFISLAPRTGGIKAVIGGYSITEGNMPWRVWRMQRQPGSSIKGFLYAVALDEEAFHLNSIMTDSPIDIAGYSPRNWNNIYLGKVSIAQALAMSINTVATQILNETGVGTFRNRIADALSLNFFEKRNRFPANLSLALGSGELSPLELAQIYGILLNEGYGVDPYLILRVEDKNRNIIWESPRFREKRGPYLSPYAYAGSIKLMQFVFDPDLGGTAGFVGKRQKKDPSYLSFPIAGKTGTVQMAPQNRYRYPGVHGVRDAWFVGLVPDEVNIVWFGQDEGVPILGHGATAALMWSAYVQKAIPQKEITSFFPEINVPILTKVPTESIENIQKEDMQENIEEEEEDTQGEDQKKIQEEAQQNVQEIEKNNQNDLLEKEPEIEKEIEKEPENRSEEGTANEEEREEESLKEESPKEESLEEEREQ